MGTVPHTPDPAQGALIDALGGGTGIVSLPDDNEIVRAAITRIGDEQLADWISFLRNKFRRRVNEFDNTGSGGTLLVNRFNFIDTPSAGVTVFTLPASGADDDVVEVAAYSIPNGNTVSIIRNGAATSIVTGAGNAGGTTYLYCMVRWFNANWHIVTSTSNEAITYGEVD
jgi:hypothetical protein